MIIHVCGETGWWLSIDDSPAFFLAVLHQSRWPRWAPIPCLQRFRNAGTWLLESPGHWLLRLVTGPLSCAELCLWLMIRCLAVWPFGLGCLQANTLYTHYIVLLIPSLISMKYVNKYIMSWWKQQCYWWLLMLLMIVYQHDYHYWWNHCHQSFSSRKHVVERVWLEFAIQPKILPKQGCTLQS